MSNPQGPDQPDEVTDQGADESAPATEVMGSAEPEQEAATEVISTEALSQDPASPEEPERRFTAPSGFDAGVTTRIDRPSEPATEVMATSAAPVAKPVSPQVIPPRGDVPKPPPSKHRSWGWVIAVVLVIAALVAVAVLGTLLLTRDSEPSVSQEDRVRSTIEDYDAAIAKGDLATLRSITCGKARDDYVTYNDKVWSDTHSRIAAAKRYPVIASIDQVVVNGDHAEANVTTFMAYAPQTRSTRSLDLEFRDDQWKICQAPTS
ncbi:hypothetical protein MGALJ_49170 [Mycobacterium gallinarum]|uniref:DUF4878 domain-containing protein n=1 Tax=Mycobacterium gallinarum TaxID=39689 RepID=A0A9W4B730_9MYCO|nr:DUF4878 domain-containing protein [Mycobacterium gallinarum]BBY95248.1 hypothetical protein MGALJ_49170 [Mycobacterium gallinarum]